MSRPKPSGGYVDKARLDEEDQRIYLSGYEDGRAAGRIDSRESVDASYWKGYQHGQDDAPSGITGFLVGVLGTLVVGAGLLTLAHFL